MMRKNREGALELSIGTIVVIVIGMSMLVLGLVLVRTIFKGSTESVDALNDQVMGEIRNIFGKESGNLVIKLGSTDSIKVKPGADPFKVAIGAQHPDGATATRGVLLYKVYLDEKSNGNCFKILGKQRAENIFITPLNVWNDFDEFSGSNSFALIEMKIPDGTSSCTQKVYVDMKLKEEAEANSGKVFILEVGKKGLF
ncbi:MAG: hypothetical protein AABX96_02415 [Nanoarchaeota archaeon]